MSKKIDWRHEEMEVVKVKTEDGKERYYVADRQGLPIEPVL